MKKWKILVIMLLSIPFLARVKYLYDAWQQSPLDQKDWIFFVLPLLLIAIHNQKIAEVEKRVDHTGWIFIGLSGSAYILAQFKAINALQIAFGLLLIFSGIYLVYGRKCFVRMAPLLAIALLGLPSSTYWVEYFFRDIVLMFSLNGFILKLIFSLIFALYFIFVNHIVRLQTLFLWTAVTIISGVLLFHKTLPQYGDPLLPQINESSNDFLMYQQPLSDVDKRFFDDNQAERFIFMSDNAPNIDLLTVKVTGKPNDIHPAELCLKTAGNQILSFREITFALDAGVLSCQEIITEINRQQFLMYAWYDSPKYSTGNFLAFRQSWRPGEIWYSTQIIMPINGDFKDTESKLRRFLNHILRMRTNEK